MTHFHPTPFLRRVLFADAAASGATGLLLASGADPLAELFGMPASLLRYAGLSLMPLAALVAWLGGRERLWRPAVWAVVAYNALWAADSMLLLFSGWVAPTALGQAFVAAQALTVALLAEMQVIGVRRSTVSA